MNKPGLIIQPTDSQSVMAEMPDIPGSPKAVAFVAGFGSGKTFILVLKLIMVKLKHPGADVLYLCPTFSMMRDILIPTLDEILIQTNIGYKTNKTTGEILFDIGGRVIVKSMDDPTKIIGMNVVAVFMDELDTIPTIKAKEIWQKAIARARKTIPYLDKEGNLQYNEDGEIINIINQLFVATTPEGFRFVYEMFKKNKPNNYTLIQASTRENKHLPDDFVANLEAIYPEELIDAYLDGQFTNLTSGTVYSEFNRETCNSKETYRKGEALHVGIDFNVLGISVVIYGKRESLNDQGIPVKDYQYNDKPTLAAFDHLQKIQDTPQLIDVLNDKYPYSKIICYPDASGANTSTKGATVSDISLLKQAGFQVKHPKKNPAIMNRVLAANSAFKNGLVKVNVDRCKDLTEAFEQQVYNDKTEMPEKNSGAGTVDDITDSATYILNIMFPIKRKSFRSIGVKEI